MSRVIRVPKAKASTRARAATLACTYWSSSRAYGAIEPDTSRISTTRRGRSPGARQRRSRSSPPWRSDARAVARRSGRRPRRAARVRRLARTGPRAATRASSRRAAARSASVYSEKSSCRSCSSSLHAAGTASSSSASSGPPLVSGTDTRGSTSRSIAPRNGSPRGTASAAASRATSACDVHSVARSARS